MKIENDKVVNHRGDVMAEKVHGQWESKDPEVLAFVLEASKPKPKKVKASKAVEEE